MKKKLTILLFENSGHWLAQALEHDFASQGSSIVDAIDGLVACMGLQMSADTRLGAEPLGTVPAAPQRYFQLAARAWELKAPTHELEGDVWSTLDPHLKMLVGLPSDASPV